MRTKWWLAFGVVCALTAAPASAAAQGFGAHWGYDFETEYLLAGLDGQFDIRIGGVPKTVIAGQLQVALTDDITLIYLNPSIRFFPFTRPGTKADPYFGGGLGLAYDDFSEEVSVSPHLVAGLEFPLRSGRPFAQLQASFGEFDQTALIVGWLFSF